MANSENSSRSLLEYVSGMTPEDINRDLDRVTEQRRRLEAEELFLESALALLNSIGHGAPANGDDREGEVVFRGSASSDTPPVVTPTLGSPNRQLVVSILREDAERVWTPKEMHDELLARGYDSKRDSIRVMLQRLTKAHLARRPQDGHYQASPIRPENLLGDRVWDEK